MALAIRARSLSVPKVTPGTEVVSSLTKRSARLQLRYEGASLSINKEGN